MAQVLYEKAKILEQFDVPRMPDEPGINSAGFACVVGWESRDRKLLDRYVKSAFEATLKARTPYTNSSRPDEPVVDVIDVDGALFAVKTSPTRKRPAYKSILDNFESYLNALAEQYHEGRLRSGYRTVSRSDGASEPYVLLAMLAERLRSGLADMLEGAEGIRQDIEIESPEELRALVPEVQSVVVKRDYGALNEYNAINYAGSRNLMSHNDAAARSFKSALLDDSLEVIGSEPEDKVALSYPCANAVFVHHIEPRSSVRYGGIVNAFLKEAPPRITARSRIGDFALLEMMAGIAGTMLREKGLVDDAFEADYDLRVIDSAPYVRLAGVSRRLAMHKEANTSPSFEQNIYVIPRY